MGISDIFKKAAKKLDEAKDPVCGMNVDFGMTKYKSVYQGKEYGFCSEHCKRQFEENPSQYVS